MSSSKPLQLFSANGFVRALADQRIALAPYETLACAIAGPEAASAIERADLNGDGVIAGENETRALFAAIDQFDGGDPQTVAAKPEHWWKAMRRERPTAARLAEAAYNCAEPAEGAPRAGEAGFDPYVGRPAVAAGPYAGAPLDVTTRRSPRILSAAEGQRYGALPGEIVVANFFHDNRFWVARLAPDSVAQVAWLYEKFDTKIPAAGHVELRFDFKPDRPLTLVPQAEGDTCPAVKLQHSVFSVEATGPKTFFYEMVPGLWPNFMKAHRWMSLAERYRTAVVEHQRTVTQIRLAVGDEAKQAMLVAALGRGDAEGLSVPYNTLADNCASGALDTVDDALKEPTRGALRWLCRHIPGFGPAYLGRQHIAHVTMPNLEDDLGSPAIS